jgi:hypothetical protein
MISRQNWWLHLSIVRCRSHLSELLSKADGQFFFALFATRSGNTRTVWGLWAVLRVVVCRQCCTLEILHQVYINMCSCMCTFTLRKAVGFMCRRAWRLDRTYTEELQLAVPGKKVTYPCVCWTFCADLFFWAMISRSGLRHLNGEIQQRGGDSDMYVCGVPNGSLRMTPKIQIMSSWTWLSRCHF